MEDRTGLTESLVANKPMILILRWFDAAGGKQS